MTIARNCLIAALLALQGCSHTRASNIVAAEPPTMMLGTFVDDYGNQYTISKSEWLQLPRNRHHIVRWHVAEQYLIAQNDSGNPSAKGQWTRIDWVRLSNMPPYDWAFCYSAFAAATAAAAESAAVARRDTPRTGCNGFPFSRMRSR